MIFAQIVNILNLILLFSWIIFGVYMTVSRANAKRDFNEYKERAQQSTDYLHTQVETLKSENTLYKNQRDFYHELLEKEREIRKK